jgi:hypothetical protein
MACRDSIRVNDRPFLLYSTGLLMKQSAHATSAPWWKFGFVWMVFGGPAVVVVASLVTVYIAMTSPNELVNEDNFRKGAEMSNSLSEAERAASMAPAVKARNHAQTGVLPTPPNMAQKP